MGFMETENKNTIPKNKHFEIKSTKNGTRNVPVLIAANDAKNMMAYIILFCRSNRPGFNIHAVMGCTINI